MSKRKIILEDKPLEKNPDREDCTACHLGIDHELLDQFTEDLIEGQHGITKRCREGFSKKSDMIEYFNDNYSKLELAFMVQMHLDGTMGSSKRISINSAEELANHEFNEALNSILKL